MDNMQFMANLPDKFADIAIIDCPYGIGEAGSKNHSRGKLAKSKKYINYSGGDKTSPPQEFFDEVIRTSKNQIFFGANHYISKIPYDSPSWIIWDKDNGNTDFADAELAYTSFKTAVRIFKYRWSGMLQENMKEKEIRIHPNHKPIDLYRWILMKYAKQGDIIMDTNTGSRSSTIACKLEGFNWIGCELSKHYFDTGEERHNLLTAQKKLF